MKFELAPIRLVEKLTLNMKTNKITAEEQQHIEKLGKLCSKRKDCRQK